MTENKIEEAREKFWDVVGDKIKEKAIQNNKTELDVLFDLFFLLLVDLMLKNDGKVSDVNLPEYMNFEDLHDVAERISLNDLRELAKLVRIIPEPEDDEATISIFGKRV